MGSALEYVPCNLCGSESFRIVYPSTLDGLADFPDLSHFRCTSSGYGKHPQIVQCSNCGLVYANPRYPPGAILQRYQEVEDPLYEQERDGRILTFQRNLEPLDELAPVTAGIPRRLLDVGSHTGALVEVAKNMGWEASGVEPSHWAAERGLERGLNIINSTLREAHFPDSHFAAITIWDVIEHLPDPCAELLEMHRVLQPGGILGIHTIDIDSPMSRFMRRRWPWLMVMHLYYFSPRTLGKMIEPMGFRVERVDYQGRYLSFGYLATRVRPYSRALARGMERLATCLSLRQLPLSVNYGDLFTLFARKPD